MNYTCIGHLYNARSAEAHISGFTIKLAIQSGKQEVQKKYFSLIFGKHSPIILVMDMFVCLNHRTLLGQPLQFRLTLFNFFSRSCPFDRFQYSDNFGRWKIGNFNVWNKAIYG